MPTNSGEDDFRRRFMALVDQRKQYLERGAKELTSDNDVGNISSSVAETEQHH